MRNITTEMIKMKFRTRHWGWGDEGMQQGVREAERRVNGEK